MAPAPPPPSQPGTVTVLAGSVITVQMIDGVNPSVNTAGQVLKASLDAPIVIDDRVIVPKGADAYVKLVNAKSAGKLKRRSELTLNIQSIAFQCRTTTSVLPTRSSQELRVESAALIRLAVARCSAR